jgi:hypothetical protein
LALLLALAGCARAAQPVPVVQAPLLENENVRKVMTAALLADAAGREVDTLYMIGATVVADGLPIRLPPRFAGVRRGGTASVTGATLEITPYLAWGEMEYQWVPAAGAAPAYGRATFVMERAGGNWRIKHLHTSTLRR